MKRLLFLITAMALLSLPNRAQVHGGPDVQWKYHDIASYVVSGPLIHPVSGSGVVLGSAQSANVSGEEWWYDIVNSYEGGEHTGYIVSGFASWTNIEFKEGSIGGCANMNKGVTGPDCSRPIRDGKPLSAKLSAVAKYDLYGNMLWCKAHSFAEEGAIAVTPSSDGGYVFTGWGTATRTRLGSPIYFNPDGVTNTDIPTEGYCNELRRKMLVGKIDANGNLEWLNQFSHFELGGSFPDAAVLGAHAIGYDVIQKPSALGDPLEYRVVGRCQDLTNLLSPGDYTSAHTKAFVVDVDEDGNKLNSWLYGDDDSWTSCREITEHEGDYYITGMQIQNSNSIAGVMDGMLFKINEAGTLLPFSSYPWSGGTAAVRYGSAGENCIGIDVKVLDNDLVAWAMLDDCNGCKHSGNNMATGRIFLYDEADPSNNVYINLGSVNTYGFSQVHAFDMKMGLTKTQDGGFACVTTIQDSPIDAATRAMEPYASILSDLDDQISYDCMDGSGSDQTEFSYGFWNTNAYVAKFDGSGNLLWDKSFDADDNGPLPFPGDWKEQECVYRMTEADDGSLVFVGNSSHNSDDYYIAKIGSDCCLRKDIANDYDINYGTDPNQELEITTTQTWTPGTFGASTVSAVGTIIVKSGVTLTIDGLTIEFADSRKMPFETKLIVERGAELRLVNGTVLTSLSECENTMWNGVQVWGTSSQPQTTAYQGKLVMDESTIENAVIGVACVKRNNFTKDLSYTGGILTIVESNFLNNLIGIEMRPYKNKTGTVESDNVSLIRTTKFLVDGPLNDAELAHVSLPDYFVPGARMTKKRAHQEFILLDGIRGVRIQGNEFTLDATYGSDIYKDRKGYGILAWDSRFKVTAYSLIVDDPSPDRNVFNNLWAGIYSKATGGSGYAVIDGSVFNNNHYGIAFDGYDFGEVTDNQFNIPENGGAGFGYIEANSGVYALSATGVIIENNVFNGVAQTASNENVGIYIENSSYEGGNAEIYNNDFDLLDISIQSAEYNDQMWVDCNDFDNDVTANPSVAWHNASGEVQDQGYCFVLPEGPQANRFLGTHTGSNYQIYNEGPAFDYRSFSESDMVLYNEVNVNETNCAATYPGLSEACPTRFASPSMMVTESEIGGLVAEIAQLEASQSGSGYSSQVAEELIYKISYMKGKLQKLIADYLETNDYASAIQLLEGIDRTETSLMMLPILIETQDVNKMSTQITAIRAEANLNPNTPQSIEWHAVCDFYELMMAVRTQQGGIEAITSTQISALETGAAQATTMAVHYTNVLQYLELEEMEEHFLQPLNLSSQKSQFSEEESAMTEMENGGLSIFPNPAANEVRIQYEADSEAGKVILQVIDISGRTVFTKLLKSERNDFTMSLSQFQSGVYLVQITDEKGTRAGQRLIVSK